MLVTCWSVKGGVGTTVVASAVALATAHPRPLLVDLAGDVPCCLGLPPRPVPGVADWLAAGPEVPPDGLTRLAVPLDPDLDLLPRGAGPLDPTRAPVLAQLLAALPRLVVVDAGRLDGADPAVAAAVVAAADRSVVVARPCLLGLTRALVLPARPDGAVVVADAGRALTEADVRSVFGCPILASVTVDPAVARQVDAGLARRRLPRRLGAALAPVTADLTVGAAA